MSQSGFAYAALAASEETGDVPDGWPDGWEYPPAGGIDGPWPPGWDPDTGWNWCPVGITFQAVITGGYDAHPTAVEFSVTCTGATVLYTKTAFEIIDPYDDSVHSTVPAGGYYGKATHPDGHWAYIWYLPSYDEWYCTYWYENDDSFPACAAVLLGSFICSSGGASEGTPPDWTATVTPE